MSLMTFTLTQGLLSPEMTHLLYSQDDSFPYKLLPFTSSVYSGFSGEPPVSFAKQWMEVEGRGITQMLKKKKKKPPHAHNFSLYFSFTKYLTTCKEYK